MLENEHLQSSITVQLHSQAIRIIMAMAVKIIIFLSCALTKVNSGFQLTVKTLVSSPGITKCGARSATSWKAIDLHVTIIDLDINTPISQEIVE